MESLFTLSGKHISSIKILQLTDTHLFCDRNTELLGVNTYQSFKAVINAILQRTHKYDVIVATGDLVQDQGVSAYRWFAQGIAALKTPCLWLVGNHDIKTAMRRGLKNAYLNAAKEALIGDNWYFILLDSQVDNAPHGELSEEQLAWLDRKLTYYTHRQTLILLHHPPLYVGCSWLDQHKLHHAEKLAAIVQKHDQVQLLLCGHIHQELDQQWHGKRILATPSTCIQFKPHCHQFTLDNQAPGWRELILHDDGRITTAVFRLSQSNFRPNMESTGY